MKFRVATAATLALGAVLSLVGFEPTSASAQDSVGDAILNAAGLSPVPAMIVDQGLIDGTGPAEAAVEADADLPPASSLNQLVSRHNMPDAIDREHECLAGAVYFESKGEPLDGQLAVAEVVMNRAQSGRFPETVCGVVFQRGQFSFVRGGDLPPINRASRAWREAVAIAQVAMDEAWESRATNALFFHASRVRPGWNRTRIATVGNHVFYR